MQKIMGFMACDNGECPKCHICLLSITWCYPENPLKVDCKWFHKAALVHHSSINFAHFVCACPCKTRKYIPVRTIRNKPVKAEHGIADNVLL
jgi:hypothetical protein